MELTQWKLLAGSGELGTLTLTGIDQPWFLCAFQPTDCFSTIKPLFDEALRLLNEEREQDWDKAQETIDALNLVLTPMQDNERIDDFLLHIDGTEAWFRY